MQIYNGKPLLIVPPRSNHIFRCIKEGLGCVVSRDYHGEAMAFSGESLAHKCSRIRSSKARNSFFYKIQETKINSSTDGQHDSSLLFIKHGRNPEQTFNQDLERNLGLSHREEIDLTAEYIPSLSNQTADWASRNFQDSSEWKLCPTVFKQICSDLGKPLLDLLASRLCQQLP